MTDLESELSWKQFATDVAALASKILVSDFDPQMIVAVARGGWIPTRYLSSLLNVKEITSIGLRYVDQERRSLENYSFPQPIATGMNILLVEDMLESAKSLAKAKELFEAKGARVKTAALYFSSHAVIIPDFSLGERKNAIKFPWEVDLSIVAKDVSTGSN